MLNPDIHELLAALSRTPELIAASTAGLSEAVIRHKKTPDEFSILENVCHLRDLEIEGYAIRIDRILSEEQPMLPDFNGGLIAAERDYNRQDLGEALAAFKNARQQNLGRLNDLEPESMKRSATLEGVGHITLTDLLAMMREHDKGHLKEFGP